MDIIKSILTNNNCYKAGKTITVKGLMIHSVGVAQPSASVFVKSWNTAKPNGHEVCTHGFIDGNTGKVYQTLPWNHRGWHCGGNANNTHIGVEMCEPSSIKYSSGSSFTVTDTQAAKKVVQHTYDSAVELFAYLCNEYKLNPLADGVILSHKEGAAKGLASKHGDPEHIWSKFGLTMDQFRKDIKNAMSNASSSDEKATDGTLYRVQVGAYSEKANADAQVSKVQAKGFETYMVKADGLYKIQVGAYSVKSNAEAMLKKLETAGFDAFITTKSGESASNVKKSITEIAKEVIAGKWGNGQERKDRLKAAGYDYAQVQAMVNKLL